jgi:hypothetical protein
MYLAAVRPFNKRLCNYNQRWGGTSYAEWQSLAAANVKLAHAFRTWADDLRAIPWTKEVRTEAEDLIRVVALSESALLGSGNAISVADYAQQQNQIDKLGSRESGLANGLRGALGIASVSRDVCDS